MQELETAREDHDYQMAFADSPFGLQESFQGPGSQFQSMPSSQFIGVA